MLRIMKRLSYGGIIGLSMLLMIALSGCSHAPANSVISGASSNATSLPITATAGVSSTALPSNIPLPARSVLVKEYSGTLNAHSATVWNYTVIGQSDTPASVIAFYTTNMPANGWTAIALPTDTAQGKYGGTALAFQQSGKTATIAAGVDQNYPHSVLLVITVSP